MLRTSWLGTSEPSSDPRYRNNELNVRRRFSVSVQRNPMEPVVVRNASKRMRHRAA
jgi:hypothetical protein